jgi:hypothetical protein
MASNNKKVASHLQSFSPNFELEIKEAQQLRRDLITRCIEEELDYLLKVNFVKALKPREYKAADADDTIDRTTPLPFMQHFFNKYFLSFPFLVIGNIKEFLDKLEVFLDHLLKAKLSTENDRSDVTKRTLVVLKLKKMLVLIYNNSINLKLDNLTATSKFMPPAMAREGSVNLDNTAKDLGKANLTQSDSSSKLQGVLFTIDVVGVRNIIKRGTFRETSYGEFIIFLQSKGEEQQSYTNKRFEQFRQLYKALIKEFPLVELPSLPDKVKNANDTLYRESDRLNLRSFLRRLLALPQIALSGLMYRFLTETQIQLTEEDKLDISQRVLYQAKRDKEMKQYIHFITKESTRYKHLWDICKKELAQPDGLMKFEQTLRTTSKLEELPEHYRAALEWGRLNFAATLYTTYCTTDNSVRFYQALVSTHKQIPYRTLSAILKYSNPTLMIKGVMDLLLAQPFGTASLMQRILTTGVTEQVKLAKDEIQDLEKQINDPLICQRIANFVYKPEERSTFDIPTNSSDYDRLLIIMNDHDIGPDLTVESIRKFWDSKQWVDQYNDPNTPSPPISLNQSGEPTYPEFQFLEKMQQLFVLQTRKRDLEQMTSLLFEGITGDLMKDVLAIFYGPLAEVYQAADISSFITKVSDFIEELIKTINVVNHSNTDSPDAPVYEKESSGGPLQEFIELSKRHEPALYEFIHNLYKQSKDGLFQNMLNWLSKILEDFKVGVNKTPLDLLGIINSKVPEDNFPTLKNDLLELKAWHWRRKVRRARNLQKKLLDSSGKNIDEDVKAHFLNNPRQSSPSQEPCGINSDTSGTKDEEDIVGIRRRNSFFDTGFGILDAEDLREMEDIEEMSLRQAYSNPFAAQSLANADLSQPMEVRLNPFGTAPYKPEATNQTISSASIDLNDFSNNSTPAKIKKFVAPKTLPQISQEPYPQDQIMVIPSLLSDFRLWVKDNLTV